MHEPTRKIMELHNTFPCLKDMTLQAIESCKLQRRFDAVEYRDGMRSMSSGEFRCAMFVLNVWNPSEARARGWTFDLLDFVANVDKENRQVVIDWMLNPVWP